MLTTGPFSYAIGNWEAPWGIEYRVDLVIGTLVTTIFIFRLLFGSIRFGPGEREMQSAIAGLEWDQDYSTGKTFFDVRDDTIGEPVSSLAGLNEPIDLWGIDVQLDSDVDLPQVDFFRSVAADMPSGSKIILCVAEPAWVYSGMRGLGHVYRAVGESDEFVFLAETNATAYTDETTAPGDSVPRLPLKAVSLVDVDAARFGALLVCERLARCGVVSGRDVDGCHLSLSLKTFLLMLSFVPLRERRHVSPRWSLCEFRTVTGWTSGARGLWMASAAESVQSPSCRGS